MSGRLALKSENPRAHRTLARVASWGLTALIVEPALGVDPQPLAPGRGLLEGEAQDREGKPPLLEGPLVTRVNIPPEKENMPRDLKRPLTVPVRYERDACNISAHAQMPEPRSSRSGRCEASYAVRVKG